MKQKIFFDQKELELLEKSLIWFKEHSKNIDNQKLYESMLRKIENSRTENLDEISYMLGISEAGMKLYFLFKEECGIDLYHSITSVLQNKERKDKEITLEELKEFYYEKYKTKRPILLEYKKELYEVIEHVYKRLKNRYQINVR